MEITIHLVCGYDLTYVSDINEISKNINYLKKYNVFTARETLKNELYDTCSISAVKAEIVSIIYFGYLED